MNCFFWFVGFLFVISCGQTWIDRTADLPGIFASPQDPVAVFAPPLSARFPKNWVVTRQNDVGAHLVFHSFQGEAAGRFYVFEDGVIIGDEGYAETSNDPIGFANPQSIVADQVVDSFEGVGGEEMSLQDRFNEILSKTRPIERPQWYMVRAFEKGEGYIARFQYGPDARAYSYRGILRYKKYEILFFAAFIRHDLSNEEGSGADDIWNQFILNIFFGLNLVAHSSKADEKRDNIHPHSSPVLDKADNLQDGAFGTKEPPHAVMTPICKSIDSMELSGLGKFNSYVIYSNAWIEQTSAFGDILTLFNKKWSIIARFSHLGPGRRLGQSDSERVSQEFREYERQLKAENLAYELKTLPRPHPQLPALFQLDISGSRLPSQVLIQTRLYYAIYEGHLYRLSMIFPWIEDGGAYEELIEDLLFGWSFGGWRLLDSFFKDRGCLGGDGQAGL